MLVITGDSTTLDGEITKVGVSEMVALAELGGVTTALVGTGAEVETGDSEAGMLVGSIDVGSTVGPEETPDPVGIPEGRMPDCVGLSLTEGTELVGMLSVSLGVGGVTPTLGVTVGVGTSPEAVGAPVGKMPDENCDTMLSIMLLAGGRGADPVAVGVSNRLVRMLGRTDAEGSGMIVGKRLDTSEIKEDRAGGTIPEGSGTGDETGAVGTAVGPAEPVGDTPATSETSDDKIDGRLSGSEGKMASEVGMAPDGDAPVPKAVVMPTTIPPEDGCATIAAGLDETSGAGVGWTGSLGRTPVDPTC